MNNDGAKIAFLSTNFSDWEKFNNEYFDSQERLLMQYLIFRCSFYGCWSESAADIQKRLGIRDKRFESIKSRFVKQDWVSAVAGGIKNKTTYVVDFEKLYSSEFLSQFYNLNYLDEEERKQVDAVFRKYLTDDMERGGYAESDYATLNSKPAVI